MGAWEEAQDLFLELLKAKADIDGEMINVTSFLNFEYRLSELRVLARGLAEKFKDKHPSLVMTAPASGIPVAQLAAEKLDVDILVYPRKASSTPKNLRHYSLCVKEVGSPTGGANNLYFRQDLLDSHKGETAIIFDDFIARNITARALYDECDHHGIKVEGFGFLLDKGWGGLNTLEIYLEEQARDKGKTPPDVYCLTRLDPTRGIFYETAQYSVLTFLDPPHRTIRVRNQKDAVANQNQNRLH